MERFQRALSRTLPSLEPGAEFKSSLPDQFKFIPWFQELAKHIHPTLLNRLPGRCKYLLKTVSKSARGYNRLLGSGCQACGELLAHDSPKNPKPQKEANYDPNRCYTTS